MMRVRARGEDVRRFVLEHVEKHPNDISSVTAAHFNITRQAVNKHLQRLTAEKALVERGKTRSKSYKLCPLLEWSGRYEISGELAEDRVWTRDIAPTLGPMPDNVAQLWHYGFTEMFNNAIEHSEGHVIFARIRKTAVTTEVVVSDDGIGIFKKVQAALHLDDERHAVLELAKGKLTTDPARHTGEGIFFSSRMFDAFDILSGGVFFSHRFGDAEDWILESEAGKTGTFVWMKLNNHTARTTKKIFDEFSSGDDYGFNKTVVPVRLAQYGDENLVSRSQAKRLLTRVEKFKTVIFDFTGVTMIGQAFADEVFRVFARLHPSIELTAIKATSGVKRMIERARSARGERDS
jgi:anti-sigma regulatory factor (Ser/Thr protein kinase)